MRGSRAFSLVELLVTLAVIVTLVGLIAPALASSRRHARKVACATQLRSIGQAFSGFVGDHDSLPLAARVMDVAYGTFELPEQLSPYLGEAAYFERGRFLVPWACPADREWAVNGVGSYGYTATWLMNDPDRVWDAYLVPTDARAGRLALLIFDADSSAMPIMHDARRFHRAGNADDARTGLPSDWQALYFDGSVRDRK